MATYYFDTSALVPLVIDEPSSRQCISLWDAADAIVTTSLALVETHSALAQATRQRRLSEAGRLAALLAFDARWNDMLRLSPDDGIIRSAATLTSAHALRGYDAVHCATALAVASDDFVAVSGDRDLLRAWSELGIPTIDTAG